MNDVDLTRCREVFYNCLLPHPVDDFSAITERELFRYDYIAKKRVCRQISELFDTIRIPIRSGPTLVEQDKFHCVMRLPGGGYQIEPTAPTEPALLNTRRVVDSFLPCPIDDNSIIISVENREVAKVDWDKTRYLLKSVDKDGDQYLTYFVKIEWLIKDIRDILRGADAIQ